MKLLLLAGSGEARSVAQGLASMPGMEAQAAAFRPMRSGPPLALPTRFGGFGGDRSFAEFLGQEEIDAVLDAAHPFAARLSARTSQICRAMGRRYARLLRPPWVRGVGDRWFDIASERDALNVIPPGKTVFVGTGRGSVTQFEDMADRKLLFRVLEDPAGVCPLPFGQYVNAKPPFTVADEVRFFRDAGVDWLVVRNVGGKGAWPKMQAARELGLPVALVRRPELPGPYLPDSDAAISWAQALL